MHKIVPLDYCWFSILKQCQKNIHRNGINSEGEKHTAILKHIVMS